MQMLPSIWNCEYSKSWKIINVTKNHADHAIIIYKPLLSNLSELIINPKKIAATKNVFIDLEILHRYKYSDLLPRTITEYPIAECNTLKIGLPWCSGWHLNMAIKG